MVCGSFCEANSQYATNAMLCMFCTALTAVAPDHIPFNPYVANSTPTNCGASTYSLVLSLPITTPITFLHYISRI